ncbi:NifU-like protein [Listeria monocytogenes]|nr:NifU-like protein [Listeria monocytogenes]
MSYPPFRYLFCSFFFKNRSLHCFPRKGCTFDSCWEFRNSGKCLNVAVFINRFMVMTLHHF